jgi:hypothetical protein
VGGLVGAAAVSAGKRDPKTGQRDPSAGPLYWLLFLGTLVLGIVALLGVLLATVPAGDVLLVALLGLAIFAPVVQLLVSFFALLAIAFLPKYEENRGGYLRSLGRITLWSVLGTLAGGLVMLVLYLALGGRLF